MLMPKTANQSMRQWQDSCWKLTPFPVPVLVTGPAAAPIDIQWLGPGNILPGRRSIDERTHQSASLGEKLWELGLLLLSALRKNMKGLASLPLPSFRHSR